MCGIDAASLEDAIIDTGDNVRAEPGKPVAANAAAVTAAIEEGVRACRCGEAAALVTAPIHKSVLTAAGFGFPGHTEFLAALTGRERAGDDAGLARTSIRRFGLCRSRSTWRLRDVFRRAGCRCHRGNRPRSFSTRWRAILAARIRGLRLPGLIRMPAKTAPWDARTSTSSRPRWTQLRARGHAVIGPLSADTLFHDEARKTLRRGALHVSRSGADPDQDARLLDRRECHAWACPSCAPRPITAPRSALPGAASPMQRA